MTTFVYKAKKSTAETVTGQIAAESQEEAIDLINQLGLLPVSVEMHDTEADQIKRRPKKIKIKELYVFSRQLANLLKSGVSLLRALNIISEQERNPQFKRVIAIIARDVKNGRTFSDSLKDFSHIFSSLFITMVRAGEESGNIQEMLVSVAIYQKKQDELRSRIRTALAYPIFMGVVGILTIYFILSFVLPKMAGLFENIGSALPLPTIILLNVSHVLSKGWIWILLGILIFSFYFERTQQSQKGKISTSRLLIHLPMLGEVMLKTELARFCRTLNLLIRSGVSIISALEISIPILSNELIKEHLYKCKDDLTSGGSFGESIRQSKEIPTMMGHLIAIGEESGNLDEVLLEIATAYEQETDEKIKLLTTLFEPMMILFVGLIIGFIVFAMLLPIFEIDVLAR